MPKGFRHSPNELPGRARYPEKELSRQVGLLASTDAGLGMVQVRRTPEGSRDKCST